MNFSNAKTYDLYQEYNRCVRKLSHYRAAMDQCPTERSYRYHQDMCQFLKRKIDLLGDEIQSRRDASTPHYVDLQNNPSDAYEPGCFNWLMKHVCNYAQFCSLLRKAGYNYQMLYDGYVHISEFELCNR